MTWSRAVHDLVPNCLRPPYQPAPSPSSSYPYPYIFPVSPLPPLFPLSLTQSMSPLEKVCDFSLFIVLTLSLSWVVAILIASVKGELQSKAGESKVFKLTSRVLDRVELTSCLAASTWLKCYYSLSSLADDWLAGVSIQLVSMHLATDVVYKSSPVKSFKNPRHLQKTKIRRLNKIFLNQTYGLISSIRNRNKSIIITKAISCLYHHVHSNVTSLPLSTGMSRVEPNVTKSGFYFRFT